MNKLFKNIIKFLAGLLIYFAISFSLNIIIIDYRDFPIKKTNILITGDSHLARALNPKLFNSAQNISQPAEPYIVTYWKLKFLLNEMKVDTILLGFSHHNISAFNDMKFIDDQWSTEIFSRVYQIQEFSRLKNTRINFGEFYFMYFRNMFLYPKWNHFTFIGKYDNAPTSYIASSETIIKNHYYKNDEDVGISETAISYLDSIIHLSQKNGIKTILIGTPVHKDYFEKIPKYVIDRYNIEKTKLNQQNISVFDYTDQFYKEEYYRNSDHLNAYGAKKFTLEIIEALRLNMIHRSNSFIN